MVFSGQIRESAAATKTFASLRVDHRVLSTPTRTIAISNISTISVGTHVTARPTALFWLLAALFLLMTLGSMRPDVSWGPLTPTGATVVLGFIALAFAGLAVRPEDKTHYLLISSNDGILSRFSAPDRSILEEVRSILTEKINRNDESMTFSVNFERGQIENLGPAHSGGHAPGQQHVTTGGRPAQPGNSGAAPDRNSQPAAQRPRPGPAQGPAEISGPAPRPQQQPQAQPQRGQPALSPAVERSGGAQPIGRRVHRLHRRPSSNRRNAPLLCASGGHPASRATPVRTRVAHACRNADLGTKVRLRELSGEMSQILGAYPQAVELFDHIDGLV